MSDNVAGKIHSQAVVDPGEGSGEPLAPPPPPHLKVWIYHCQVKLKTKLENWKPAMLMGRLTTKHVDRLTAKLVNHLTAKLMNHLTPKLVDHLTTKLMVVNIIY